MPRFLFDPPLPEPRTRLDVVLPPRAQRRGWTRDELVALFPPEGLDILDVGAGGNPLKVREHDRLVTVDFAPRSDTGIVADVTREWPFPKDSFDVIYMSHVVEHFYPQDRDQVVRRVYGSLRPEGLVCIRVPHKSSRQATGWEHYSLFGMNGLTSLCHGESPVLPWFRCMSTGVALSTAFDGPRSVGRRMLEAVLNRAWNATDTFLGPMLGGIAEVQFLLQRMPADVEERLATTSWR